MLIPPSKQNNYPECYQLDKNVFSLNDIDLKDIAHQQQEFIKDNRLTDDNSFIHFITCIEDVTGKDYITLKDNLRWAYSLFE